MPDALTPALTKIYLDVPRLCRLEFREGQVRLVLPERTGPVLLSRLLSVLEVRIDRQAIAFHRDNQHSAQASMPPQAARAQIFINGQCLAEVNLAEKSAGPIGYHQLPLTITDLRRLGEYQSATPYPRLPNVKADGLVFSDFHTHSSGELSGRDLLKLAASHGIAYPVRLLHELGFSDAELPPPLPDLVPRVIFQPLQKEEAHLPMREAAVAVADISNAVRKKLAASMDAPFDRQATFGDLEHSCYRFRYPLSKEPALLMPCLMKIGENYKKQGIHYAEITMTSIEKPYMLEAIHRAVPRVKQKYGVDLRFLVGIPRTLDSSHLRPLIEKTKILAKSPYIVGADIIGYETNKTSHLLQELESLARWARQGEHREFTLRVHAGENAKNPDNVYQVLQLAERFNVRVRVGHALHGLDEKSLQLASKLAAKGLLVLEFNPDSNIALNNMDRLEQLPFEACQKYGIDFVLGTDGSGIYGTSAAQLALSAHAGFLSEEGQAWLRRSQNNLIHRQQAYSEQKYAALAAEDPAFPHDPLPFLQWLGKQCSDVDAAPPAPVTAKLAKIPLPPKSTTLTMLSKEQSLAGFIGLTPIVLAGASGSSWARMSRQSQFETALALDVMVHLLDPEKVMFVHGRGKERGIVAELSQALSDASIGHFQTLGIITQEHWSELVGERMKTIASHLTHVELNTRGFLSVPDSLMTLALARQGMVIAAGGAAFTRDVILRAKQADLPTYLLECAQGASQDKAKVMPERAAPHAAGLAVKLYQEYPALFREPLTEASLSATMKKSQKRITRRTR